MLFFPDLVAGTFAWDVHPRYAMAFIGAGYIFRTAFFLNAAREGNWVRLRWIVWGNLVFTGTLLLATFWHADEFNWDPFRTVGHLWLVLYIFEPVVMIYLIPRGTFALAAPPTGGPLHPVTKGFFVLLTGVLLMHGLLLVINPEFAATRWAWELNPLDARMVGGLVPRLGGVARDDGVRAGLGRGPAGGPAVPAQRGRVAGDRGRLPRRLHPRQEPRHRLRRRPAR